jgi:ribosomal protein L23
MTPVDVSLLNTTHKGRSSRKTVKKPLKKAIITMAQGDILAL